MAWLPGDLQAIQDSSDSWRVRLWNTPDVTSFMKALEATMPKTDDHLGRLLNQRQTSRRMVGRWDVGRRSFRFLR